MTQTRDFSRPRNQISFTIDQDTFHAAPVLPADHLLEFVGKFSTFGESTTPTQMYAGLLEILRGTLAPESFARFDQRLKSTTEPIDLNQMADIVPWLLEQYGLRPTQPSSGSADGSPNPGSGISSTGTTSPEGSIPSTFLPTGS